MTRWMPPPLLFAIAALAMAWIGHAADFGGYDFAQRRSLAAALVAVGVVLVVLALRAFFAARTTPNPLRPQDARTLVTTGPYAWSRNPMYLGDAIALAGIAVWTGNLLSLLPLAAFVACLDRWQIPAEEAALAVRFGERYAAYRREVRRWL
jgi:protein-S-isoprenylcysteine O-methyltransferase Ste14